jgi:DNA-directed RNA polymerase subunit RPC12/RpoP
MAKVKIETWGYKCERCSHEWVPRNEPLPLVCPRCKSPYWNRPRRTKKGGESRGDRK